MEDSAEKLHIRFPTMADCYGSHNSLSWSKISNSVVTFEESLSLHNIWREMGNEHCAYKQALLGDKR